MNLLNSMFDRDVSYGCFDLDEKCKGGENTEDSVLRCSKELGALTPGMVVCL